MKQTLSDLQRAAGASFCESFGVDLPARFSDFNNEFRAARAGAAVVDAGFRSLLIATGADRVSFFQGMLSNDVAKLSVGHWMDAAHLTVQARIVSDLRVLALADELWLDVPAQRREPLRQTLEKFIIADDVELHEPQLAPLLALEGPRSAALLAGLLGEDAPPARGEHRAASFGGSSLRVAGLSLIGGEGFYLWGPPPVAVELWQRCTELGALPVGMEALDALRIEAGIPWYGCDMDESILAPEAGLAGAISFSKGCYLGQEIVERATARGQLQKRLVGLFGHSRVVPERGTRLLHAGDDVGWITSAAFSPTKGALVALGYLRRNAWAPGTEIEVAGLATILVVDERVAAL